LMAQQWATPDQLMFVVGATQAEKMESIRKLAPEYFFLVPGIGAQGGDLEMVSRNGMNKKCGLLVNAARSVIYASAGEDFASAARAEAVKLQKEMERYLDSFL
jgi:orotidine-5'-phosphate decarboxylase